MKLRSQALIVTLLTLAAACSKPSAEFTLTGTVDISDTLPILVTGIDTRYDRIDTIRPADGKFCFRCLPDTVTPLLFLYSDGRRDIVFADRNLQATYERHIGDSMASVQGGPWNLEYRQFAESLTDISYIDRIDSLIDRDPLSEVAPCLLYEYSRRPDADSKRITDAINSMSGQMLDNATVSDLKREFSETSRYSGVLTQMNIKDTLMQKTAITDLCQTGHTLVCVWASWDGKSRIANRNLYGLTDKYRKKSFRLAGISLDVNPDRWMEAVRQDSLFWDQYCDLGGWAGRLVQQVRFDELPYYILLAPGGRIQSRSADLDIVMKRLDDAYDR